MLRMFSVASTSVPTFSCVPAFDFWISAFEVHNDFKITCREVLGMELFLGLELLSRFGILPCQLLNCVLRIFLGMQLLLCQLLTSTPAFYHLTRGYSISIRQVLELFSACNDSL
jgi:hypothetical protein